MIKLTEEQKRLIDPETEETKRIQKLDTWKIKYETKKLQQAIDHKIQKQAGLMESLNSIMESLNECNNEIQNAKTQKSAFIKELANREGEDVKGINWLFAK